MADILEKIKEKGFLGTLQSVKWKIFHVINKIAFFCCRLGQVDEVGIVLESEPDLCDNAYALFDYMKQNGYIGKYKITWLVECAEDYTDEAHVQYASKYIGGRVNWKAAKALAQCKYYIYDHCDIYSCLAAKRRKGQKRVFLTHGGGFKAATEGACCLADEVYATGKLFYHPISAWCGCSQEKMLDIGYPRLDYFFKQVSDAHRNFQAMHQLAEYNKVFLWMPTFRRSYNINISEDYFESDTGLPVLYRENELEEFDELLRGIDSVCIFKVHHLQMQRSAFKKEYTNIVLLNDNDIREFGLQLYQFIVLTDVLITDYSSVSSDYMLLDRPVIYTLDDYGEYKRSRGFTVNDPKRYFAGYHIYNKHQLFVAVKECSQNMDLYSKKRKEVLPLMHTHIDGNASARILKHLGIRR